GAAPLVGAGAVPGAARRGQRGRAYAVEAGAGDLAFVVDDDGPPALAVEGGQARGAGAGAGGGDGAAAAGPGGPAHAGTRGPGGDEAELSGPFGDGQPGARGEAGGGAGGQEQGGVAARGGLDPPLVGQVAQVDVVLPGEGVVAGQPDQQAVLEQRDQAELAGRRRQVVADHGDVERPGVQAFDEARAERLHEPQVHAGVAVGEPFQGGGQQVGVGGGERADAQRAAAAAVQR